MMLRIMLIPITMVIVCFGAASGKDSTDVLRVALDSARFSRSDIGYQPKGYWSRFPLDIPYRLTSFDDLFAEPFKLYDYSKTMANAVERYLEPAFLDTSSSSLYYLTYSLGVDRKLGGFRNYSANLTSITDSIRPLEKAIESLFAMAEDEPAYSSEAKAEWKQCKDETLKLSAKIPSETELILARIVINLEAIIHWRNLAIRNCDPTLMRGIYKIRKLALTQPDGTEYYPEMDDIASTIDFPSLHYAALKTAAIVEETADSLAFYRGMPPDDYFQITTPFGKILLIGSEYFNGKGVKSIDCDNSLLVIDFGNSGIFHGACGATADLHNPVSVFIDLGGDDTYMSNEASPSQAAGILGVGLLYDASGNDAYIGAEYTQGTGLFGVGILFDKTGNDEYKAELSGQGCGYFGIGLCLDAAGDDDYYIYGAGQGFGGVGGGIGVLGEFSGNDSYIGEPSPEVFDMADYHSKMKINGNGVQGVGFGRRGDMTDGHSWAGGLGAIIDITGDDHYLSGNWSLGCAYWFSTGIAYDGSGDDVYESCYFTQGSGAHFCNSILIDEGGNDKHELYETAGAALGFGWDFANAFLINIGGNDSYRANMISMGLAQIRSNAFLIDIGGNDSYRLQTGTAGLGEASFREYYRKPMKVVTYYSNTRSFGCFIDIGGRDEYFSFDDSLETAHPRAGNNRFWFAPAKSDSTYGHNNYGIGIDVEDGVIPEIERWK